MRKWRYICLWPLSGQLKRRTINWFWRGRENGPLPGREALQTLSTNGCRRLQYFRPHYTVILPVHTCVGEAGTRCESQQEQKSCEDDYSWDRIWNMRIQKTPFTKQLFTKKVSFSQKAEGLGKKRNLDDKLIRMVNSEAPPPPPEDTNGFFRTCIMVWSNPTWRIAVTVGEIYFSL